MACRCMELDEFSLNFNGLKMLLYLFSGGEQARSEGQSAFAQVLGRISEDGL